MTYVIYSVDKMKFLEPIWTTQIDAAMYFEELVYTSMWVDLIPEECQIMACNGLAGWESVK